MPTIEVLPVELLDKLEHHSVDSSLPKDVTSREAFSPRGLSALSTIIVSQIANGGTPFGPRSPPGYRRPILRELPEPMDHRWKHR